MRKMYPMHWSIEIDFLFPKKATCHHVIGPNILEGDMMTWKLNFGTIVPNLTMIYNMGSLTK